MLVHVTLAATAKPPCQWTRPSRNGASWDFSAGSACKAREIDGIDNGTKPIGTMESGVNTSNRGCY